MIAAPMCTISIAAAAAALFAVVAAVAPHSDAAAWTAATAEPPFPLQVSGVRNVTVYRLTPANYTGLSNLNSGDLAGDLGFGLCEEHPRPHRSCRQRARPSADRALSPPCRTGELLIPMQCREDKTSEVGCQTGTGRFIDAPGEASHILADLYRSRAASAAAVARACALRMSAYQGTTYCRRLLMRCCHVHVSHAAIDTWWCARSAIKL